MSKFTEYIDLIRRGIPNADKVIEGIFNDVQFSYGRMKQEERNEIVKRRLICASCPFMSKNATSSQEYKELKGKNYETVRTEDHCSLCGCGIKAKTASLASDCGAKTHNEEQPENVIPLKWTKFEKDVKRD